ncbi:MAG: hypothetical protein ABIQ47_06025 [Tepidiformaceae bacterium]
MCRYLGLILGLLRRALRPRQNLLMENLVLREQLAVCVRQPRRRRLRREDRLLVDSRQDLDTMAVAPSARSA